MITLFDNMSIFITDSVGRDSPVLLDKELELAHIGVGNRVGLQLKWKSKEGIHG